MKPKPNFWKGLKLFTIAATAAVLSSALSKASSVQAGQIPQQTIEQRLEKLSKEIKNRAEKNKGKYSSLADPVLKGQRFFFSQSFENSQWIKYQPFRDFANHYPFRNFINHYPLRGEHRKSSSFVRLLIELIEEDKNIS